MNMMMDEAPFASADITMREANGAHEFNEGNVGALLNYEAAFNRGLISAFFSHQDLELDLIARCD